MPTYDVTDPQSGSMVTLEGDSPPTEKELIEVFQSIPTKSPSVQSKRSNQPIPFDYGMTGPQKSLRELTDEDRAMMEKPLLTIPDLVPWQVKAAAALGVPGAPTAEKVMRGAIAPVKGVIESATSPVGIAMAPALVGAPELAGLVMAGQAVKEGIPEASRKIGEASVTGDVQELAQGISEFGLNAAVAIGGPFALKAGPGAFGGEGAKPKIESPPIIPFTEAAVKEIIPESRRLTGTGIQMPEFQESTLEPGGPPPKALPAPGEGLRPSTLTEMGQPRETTLEPGINLPTSPLAEGRAGHRIELPVEPETAAKARRVWSKPIDIEAQVTGVEALRQLVSMTEETKTPGEPYKPPTVSIDLRQLERQMQRNTVSKVESWADEVIQRKLGETGANPFLDPEFMAAAMTKGAILFKKGITKLNEWDTEMRKQFGRGLDAQLPSIYKQSKDYWEGKQGKNFVAPQVEPQAVEPTLTPKTEPITPEPPGTKLEVSGNTSFEGPGAASESDFPTAPGRFSRATESALDTLRKGRDAIKNVWQNRDVRQQMAVDKDALDNQARLSGRVAANDVRGDIKRTFKKEQGIAEDALSFVIESKGDYDALDAMREKLIQSEKADPTWRKRAVDAIDYAKYHWEELRDSASKYEDITNAQLDEENKAGIDTLKRNGYVMHAQDVDESVLGGGGEPTGFKKVRTHDTFADSISNGVDPKTLNAVDLLESRVSAGQRMINNRAWVEGLKDLKATDGTPIATALETVKRADGSSYQQAPRGYHMEGVGRTPIAVRDGFEGLFHALTDPSAWSRTATGRSAMDLATTSKSAVLAFDTFHLGRIAFWDSLIKALGIKTFKAPFPSYKKGVSLLDTSEAEFTKMAKSGEIPEKWLPELTESKRKLDLAVKTGFNIGRISDALYSDWVHAIPVIGDFNKFLFDQFQRGAMAETWLLEFDRLKQAKPGLGDLEAARQVSSDLNTRFGNLGRQGIFKSRTAQDTARTLLLAPQWNEGLIRSELGAIKQTGEMFMDAAHGQRIYAGVLLRSVGGMVAAQFAANQIINYITRGKPTWENPEEGMGSKLSAWIPDVVGKGPGFFLHPMGLAAETTHLLLNAYARTGDFQKTLMNYIRSRASVAMRPILTFITNSDFLGRTLKPGTVWGEMAKESVPVPIGAGAIGSAVKQLATGKESETFPGQIQKQVMASFGVKTEQAPAANARITKLADEFLKDRKIDRPKWQGAPGDYSEVTSQLKVGNEDAARKLMSDLLDKKKASDIASHFRDYPHTTFTGKRSLENAFFKSLNPEQQSTYKQAVAERVDIAKRAVTLLREEFAKKKANEKP